MKIERERERLFNLVLSSGCFPDIWSQGLITPIHKSGNKLDPNHFRGICVSSNLGKLFSSILNHRMVHFPNEHNVLSPSQIGFLPNHRTTDHIYTLHTLINKYVKQTKNGKIFACFIDFKKAFDSIWHDRLYYKLLQSSVGGKVYDIVKSMATNIQNSSPRKEECGRAVAWVQPCSTSTLMNWRCSWNSLQPMDSLYKTKTSAFAVCRWSGAAVIHPTGTTATPRPAGELLPELGPGSKPQKDQHYGLSEKAQMSGTQIPVQSRQHRPRTHDAVHLPRPDHHCIGEFQYGSECSQR